MSACSGPEAEIWRRGLLQANVEQSSIVNAGRANIIQFHSSLLNDMRSIGQAHGKPGSFTRRMSVHRSQTVGPLTDLSQVIIKNTQSVKDAIHGAPTGSIQGMLRSQSVQTPSHILTLTPHRSDRIRLEQLLADVWSANLPFPGMKERRADQLRGSANHVIRKLSMASITSTFSSKRSQASSMPKSHKDPAYAKTAPSCHRTQENARPPRLPLSELLPADFDLYGQPSGRTRRYMLRALTMTGAERDSSPAPTAEPAAGPMSWGAPAGGGPGPATAAFYASRASPMPLTGDQLPTLDERSVAASRLSNMRVSTPAETTALPATTPKKAKSKSRLRRLFG